MCSACGFPPALGHWTDAGGETAHDRLRIRFSRAALVTKLVQPLGVKVTDLGLQPGLQLSNGTGKTVICDTLEDVWAQIETLTGTPFDPLNTSLGA
ncbi:hypothetical protein [Pacificibacter sp. AS14]|uniref:hypothetical protein n=1 Tax=Pacificibacter sp. AS14 TaxID=3135785 RepID=UPI0031734D98